MRVHWLQHVPYEGLGSIKSWMEQQGHDLTCTRVWESRDFPDPDDIDWLIIMGGPMGVYDEKEYPWLIEEKAFIKRVLPESILGKKRAVLGICLGAQLIAEELQARIYTNPAPELGWGSVQKSASADLSPVLHDVAGDFKAFHWHFDTFGLPLDCEQVFSSEACENQGFIYDDRVLGLQFHLECKAEDVERMIEHGADDLAKAGLGEEEIAAMCASESVLVQSQAQMAILLEALQAQIVD